VTPFDCLDCDIDTSAAGEYYMLRDEVWLEANPLRHGMLCVGCVEERLERRLTPVDFSDAPVNRQPNYMTSERLLDRLGRADKPPITDADYDRDMQLASRRSLLAAVRMVLDARVPISEQDRAELTEFEAFLDEEAA
jgi:hypothetical protein